MASVHHHELSTDSEGPRRSTAAQQPPAEHARSAWFRARARGRKARAAGARGRASSYQLSAPPLRAQVAPCATQLTASLRSPVPTIRAHDRSMARVGQPSDNISSGPVGVTRGLPPQIFGQPAPSICAGRGLSRMSAARGGCDPSRCRRKRRRANDGRPVRATPLPSSAQRARPARCGGHARDERRGTQECGRSHRRAFARAGVCGRSGADCS